jgi:N-dimethylarginine dimethylaminohydrolase
MSTAVTMRSPVVVAGERQILVRIDRAVRITEDELRYQLRRKDSHPLAELEDDGPGQDGAVLSPDGRRSCAVGRAGRQRRRGVSDEGF